MSFFPPATYYDVDADDDDDEEEGDVDDDVDDRRVDIMSWRFPLSPV